MTQEPSYGIQFEEEPLQGGRLLRVTGNIDTDSYQRFEERVTGLTEAGVQNLVLDLEKAPLINSMGVGVIVRAYRHLKDASGSLILLNPSPGIRQVLATLMLERKLTITATLEEARSIMGCSSAA